MKLVLLGIQGSGKSTQGNLLSHQLHIPYLSTGHIFRLIAREKTTLGRYIKEMINTGVLIPDDRTIEIVNQYLGKQEYQKGYILDGFPRTVRQAKKFRNNVDRVIYIKIPDKDALWRLLHRNDSTRSDETLPALKKRIDLFKKLTLPVVDYYRRQKKLTVINGVNPIEVVNKEILHSLGKQLIKNHVAAWKEKKKAIIALVGMPGSGKTDAADYLKKKGLPVITFGKIVNDYIENNKLPHDEAHHQQVRVQLRKQYGQEAMAVLNADKIVESLKKNLIVVIDGMRSWEEYEYIKKHFSKAKLFIIALYADKEMRYKRINSRKHLSKLYGQLRDVNEIISTNVGSTIAYADYMVKNNFSIDEFHDKLEEVYRSIYFSL